MFLFHYVPHFLNALIFFFLKKKRTRLGTSSRYESRLKKEEGDFALPLVISEGLQDNFLQMCAKQSYTKKAKTKSFYTFNLIFEVFIERAILSFGLC